MWPVSAQYLEAAKESSAVVSFAEVVVDGQVEQNLGIVQGSVMLDTTATVYRTLQNMQIYDPTGSLTPQGATDLLGPAGGMLRTYRGFQYTDGTVEVAPTGLFTVSVNEITDDPVKGVTMSITGYDLSRKVRRDGFLSPIQLAGGATPVEAILEIAANAAPWLTEAQMNLALDGMLSEGVLPPLIYPLNTSPWTAMQEVATAGGGIIFFDAAGWLTMVPMPDPATAPIVDYYVEGQGNEMVRLMRRMDDQYVVNTWIVSGGSSMGPPLYAVAQDTDPNSPTNVDTYGVVSKVESSTLVTTQAQAQAMADALLLGSTGLVEYIQWDAAVNGALEGYDVVYIQRAASKIASPYQIQNLNIPHDAKTKMTGQTRLTELS